MLDYHPSFEPVQKLFAVWDAENQTPCEKAKEHLACIKEQIKQTDFLGNQAALVGQTWGVVPRGARRTVLSAAGLDPEQWERPITSFSAVERAALLAAARAAVRVYERVVNAI